MAGSLLIIPVLLATAVIFARWVVERARHNARLRAIPVRVHVNGIRGKSTVVRLLASALRADGRNVVAKTTGSAPRVIDHQGRDHEIDRRGAPTMPNSSISSAQRCQPTPTRSLSSVWRFARTISVHPND